MLSIREAHERALGMTLKGLDPAEACGDSLDEAYASTEATMTRCVREVKVIKAASERLGEAVAVAAWPYIISVVEGYVDDMIRDHKSARQYLHREPTLSEKKIDKLWSHFTDDALHRLPDNLSLRHQAAQLLLAGEADLKVARKIIEDHAAAVKAHQDQPIVQRNRPVKPLIILFD